MRVTLIVPPSGFLLDDRVFPALGVLKVAAVLERSGVDVSVLDLCGESDVAELVSAYMDARPSDVYGITATMPQMPVAASIASQIREADPKARLILGGPHVTLMQASARQEVKKGTHGRASRSMDDLSGLFDVLVCGDGEEAVSIALESDPPALIDADDPKSKLFMTPAALESAPFAARHLIDLTRYHYSIDGVRAQSLICQLGCPFGCNFCGGRRSPFLRKVRTRSSDQVIAEMRHLYESCGTRGFMFFDDELNVNTKFMELLDKIVGLQDDLGVEFRIRGFLKAELLTEPMATAMYAAGFRQVLVGFESGHPRILQNIQKKATRDDNTRAVEMLQAAGIRVKAAMSVGHPGESEETIEATRQWLLEVQPAEFDVTIITVYPGTPYYDDATETAANLWTYVDPRNGDRLHARSVDHLSEQNFYKGVPGSYQSFVYTDNLSAEELCELRDDVEADVRRQLAIPYPTSAAAQYEGSMGQLGAIQ
jgi:anaerobic magnesium-protoporphyrin IX monomethyl ester cyclase